MNLFDFSNINYLKDLEEAMAGNPAINLDVVNPENNWTLLFSAKVAEAGGKSAVAGGGISTKIVILGGKRMGDPCAELARYKPNVKVDLLSDSFIEEIINYNISNNQIDGLISLVLAEGDFKPNRIYRLKEYQLNKITNIIKKQANSIENIDMYLFTKALLGFDFKINKEKNIFLTELTKKINLKKRYKIAQNREESDRNTGCFLQGLFFQANQVGLSHINNIILSHLITNTSNDDLKATRKAFKNRFYDYGPLGDSVTQKSIVNKIEEELKLRGNKSIEKSFYFAKIIDYFRGKQKEEPRKDVSSNSRSIPNKIVLYGIDISEKIDGLNYLLFNFDEELNERLKNLNNQFKNNINYLVSEKDKGMVREEYYSFVLRIKTDYFKELQSSLFKYNDLRGCPIEIEIEREARSLIMEQIDRLGNHLDEVINQSKDVEEKLKGIRLNNATSEAKFR